MISEPAHLRRWRPRPPGVGRVPLAPTHQCQPAAAGSYLKLSSIDGCPAGSTKANRVSAGGGFNLPDPVALGHLGVRGNLGYQRVSINECHSPNAAVAETGSLHKPRGSRGAVASEDPSPRSQPSIGR